MTAPAIPGLAEAIEAAIETAWVTKPNNFPSAEVAISDALGMWWWDYQSALWECWNCDNDECPGRPAWDIALSEQGEQARKAAKAEALAFIRQRMAEFAVTFQAEHPEAILREPEAVTAA